MTTARLLLTIPLLLAAAAAPAGAQPSVTIRLGTMAPEGSPWHDVLTRMKQDWRDVTGGKVDLKIYSGVLGDESEMIRKMRIGQLQAVAISGAALPRIDVGVACLEVPLMFESYEELDYVRDRLAPELERRMGEQGFVILNWGDAGWIHFFTKRPVRTPDDLRRLKLLTSAGDLRTEQLYKDFGLRVVPLPYTEVLMALETGLIEAVQGPPLYALLDQWFGLANHMTDMRWAPLVGATVIRKDTWESLPEKWRTAMLASAEAAGNELRAEIRRLGDEAVPEMVKRGLEVVTLDAALMNRWRAEAEAAYPRLRGEYAPADLFDEALRLRGEFRARTAAGAAPVTRSPD
jgi:TRAP-type C4-dicarboxylate transport system substrate-binding protein